MAGINLNPNLDDELYPDLDEAAEAIPMTPLEALLAREREGIEFQQRRSGLTSRSVAETTTFLQEKIAKNDDYYARVTGGEYQAQIGQKSGSVWEKATEQAIAREKAFAAHQQALFNKSLEQRQAGDVLGAATTLRAREWHQVQHMADVMQDTIDKEKARQKEPRKAKVPDLEAQREAVLVEAGKRYREMQHARGLQYNQTEHRQRQEVYKDLQQFAKDQGADRAADFVGKYAAWKVAQNDLKIANVAGTEKERAAAAERYQQTMAVAKEAKAGLKTSEVAALQRASAARHQDERAFTKYFERQQAKAPAISAEEADRSPFKAEGVQRDRIEKLQAAGFKDKEFIEAASLNGKWSDRALQAQEKGFKDQTVIAEISKRPGQFERAAALKESGLDNERWIAIASRQEGTAKLAQETATDKDLAGRIAANLDGQKDAANDSQAKPVTMVDRMEANLKKSQTETVTADRQQKAGQDEKATGSQQGQTADNIVDRIETKAAMPKPAQQKQTEEELSK